MQDKLTNELSAISRTNQLKISDDSERVAEKIYQFLFKKDKGIEHFELEYSPTENENSENEDSEDEYSKSNFFQKRHKYIQKQIQERLSVDGKKPKYSDIQYFLSYSDGKTYIFFLSTNKYHSGWKKLFKDNRERIFNLVFKFYLLSEVFSDEIITGFEELFFLHSKNLTKSKDALLVWGQNLLIKYNHHDVLTLTLTRKSRRFLREDKYSIEDGDDLGELLVYKKKKYYFDRDRDARRSNSINFMVFPQDNQDFDKFKKTQLYYYQNLMTKLESFLSECNIEFKTLDFQADYYLENPFIKNIKSVGSLEIINNVGTDLTESDRQFLTNILKHQGVDILTFYQSGKTISTYKLKEIEGEEAPCWKITEVISWSSIKLDKGKNYLVLNKLLDEETGSMAYQRDDGFWIPSTKIDKKNKIDFYSQLKKRYNYLETGDFFSTQGINIPEFKTVAAKKQSNSKKSDDKDKKSSISVLSYTDKKIDLDTLGSDTQPFTNGGFLEKDDCISCYLSKQENKEEWEKFVKKYALKISPEFQKVLIELGIKNWIRQSIINSSRGLNINSQSFSEKTFSTIYVRSPRKKETKAIAVEFLYKEGSIYIKNIMRDLKEIKKKFKFLRKQKNNSEKLINDQQYFVDESEKIYISCYTSDYFTPTLIGRNGILEELENGTLKINRAIKGKNSSKLLPLISYYNSETKFINEIQKRICLDLSNEDFIQYYVPPAKSLESKIKKGFRVYHLIGKTYSKETILTSELIKHPIAALHFSTLTHNILKISENSQSSLLQKVAKVLVEN
ncbi:MAG: hypothetical protein ACFBSE_19165 [Prochloraceae cyanobacterium]